MQITLPFNRPPYTGAEDKHVTTAMRSAKLSGDGEYTRRCERWFEEQLGCARTILTPSCTHALELAAILAQIGPGDEVIMPSYTFVSTANAFALRGATIVFVDVRADTMNLDESLVEAAVTERTRAIVPVHYAGVSCDMTQIMEIAERHRLLVIEDAAQAFMSRYKGAPVGTKGHLSAFSFHETKNITSGGEGGMLAINAPEYVPRAEIIREKGTNRSQYFRGMVDKYSWVDIGSSYLPGELQAAYLWGQLESAALIQESRHRAWRRYRNGLLPLAERGLLQIPTVPADCDANAHMFYIKVGDLRVRTQLLEHLKCRGILAVFHYVPLHSAPVGSQYGRFSGVDSVTTDHSERLLRLPLFYGISDGEVDQVVSAVSEFFDI